MEISVNVAVGAGSIVMFAGFMLGYAIAWRQRRSQPVPLTGGHYHFGGPLDLGQPPALRETPEDRVRRAQQ